MEVKEKIERLEEHGLNWLEISEILGLSFEEVRDIAQND